MIFPLWTLFLFLPVQAKSAFPPKDNLLPIKGGVFMMGDLWGYGSSDELPVHTVTVADFLMDPYEVTAGDYLRFVKSTKSNYPAWMAPGSPYNLATGTNNYYRPIADSLLRPRQPIVGINWYNAVSYCNWLSAQRGLKPVYLISGDTVQWNADANGYRLPTEAEWEYTARQGGHQVLFGNGKDTAFATDINFDARISGKRTYADTGIFRGTPLPVGSFAPNRLGLFDMSGNVWEWCQDWYSTRVYERPQVPEKGARKVMRGGSWYFDGYSARVCNRHHARPEQCLHNTGFRLARNRF